MKLLFKLTIILALGAGIVTLSSCGDGNTDDPVPTETTPTCKLTSTNEVSQGSGFATIYTYDASGSLTSYSSDGFTVNFTYIDGRVNTMSTTDVLATAKYDDNGNIPERITMVLEGDTSFIRFEYTGDQITTIEDHFIEDGISELAYISFISYNSDGTLNSITEQEYDADSETTETLSTIKNITSDDKINPYISSQALILISLLEENYDKLGKGNVLTAEYDYMINEPSNITNTYTYNNEGYPISANQKGFSDETNFTFTYDCK